MLTNKNGVLVQRLSIDGGKVNRFHVFKNALMLLNIVLRAHERRRSHSLSLFLPALFSFLHHFTRKFNVQQVARQDNVDSLRLHLAELVILFCSFSLLKLGVYLLQINNKTSL